MTSPKATIYLGICDTGKTPIDKSAFLKPYHWVQGVFNGQISFRDDERTVWRPFREKMECDGEVEELQTFLHDAGFMPRAKKDGIFGYVTQASVRLFQEYVRTIEGVPSMIPDGFVGQGTWSQIELWQKGNKVKVSEWGASTSANNKGSEEYKKWMTLLKKAKTHYLENPSSILQEVKRYKDKKETETLAVDEWRFDPSDIHLIGVRHGQFEYNTDTKNEDIFLLLIKGMVFKFWGSTVPNNGTAFLVEGQHKYRFGWHKIGKVKKDKKTHVYRALRPSPKGVLVLRNQQIDSQSNHTINIHWTGLGISNWSAGCMVIAGKNYINNRDQVIDCSKFAARRYTDLNNTKKKTKGAYNLFADLILAYAPEKVNHLYFTLGRDSSLDLDSSLGNDYRKNILKVLK